MSDKDEVMPPTYGAKIPLMLDKDENVKDVRRFLRAAGQQVSVAIMQTWLAHPADYDIDIKITMTETKK